MSILDPDLYRQLASLVPDIKTLIQQQGDILSALKVAPASSSSPAGSAAAGLLVATTPLMVPVPLTAEQILRAAAQVASGGVEILTMQLIIDVTDPPEEPSGATDNPSGGPRYVLGPLVVKSGYYAQQAAQNLVQVHSDTWESQDFVLNGRLRIDLGSHRLYQNLLEVVAFGIEGWPANFEINVGYEVAQMSSSFFENIFSPLLERFGLAALQGGV